MSRPKLVPVTLKARYGIYNAGETAGFKREEAQRLVDGGLARAVTIEELRKKYPKENLLERVAVLKGGDDEGSGKRR